MIQFDFLILPEGGLLGFHSSGHAGHGNAGTDIVCAAVSSAAYLTANTITDVLMVLPEQLQVHPGEMLMRVSEKDAIACRDLLLGLKNHMLGLEEQYTTYIRVGYVEV